MVGTGKITCVAAALLLLGAGNALAGGFSIYEAGARATAMGGAFTATADDGSAIFYNPAGIAFIPGTVLDLNLMPVMPSTDFTGYPPGEDAPVGETVSQSFPIPGLYFTHNPGQHLAFGVGVYAPFGLGVEWQDPETWVGRRASYDVDLATVYVTPTCALKLGENTAVAFGLDVSSCRIELNRYRTTVFNDQLVNVMDTKLEGTSDLAFAPSFGFMARPHRDVSLGFMYHAAKALQFPEGDATLTNVAPEALRAAIDGQIAALGGPEHEVSTTLRLPWIMSTGIAWQTSDATRLEFDVVRFGWSQFNELKLHFDVPVLDSTIPENYQDAWQLRWGLDHRFSPALSGMLGYCHDVTPQPIASMSPLLPDAGREDLSVGFQYRTGALKFTGSYMAVLFHERTNVVDGEYVVNEETQPVGTYDSTAHIFGIGIGYQF